MNILLNDFEKYAFEKPMDGQIAGIYKHFFYKWVEGPYDGLRVLDLGCGDGKYLSFFKGIFKEDNIFGAEISRIRVERCRERGWKNIFLIEKLKPLPFPGRYFDLINFDNVIEHIHRQEIDFYLSEFVRILKRGGKMIICTPNYPVKRLYDLMSLFLEGDLKRLRDDPTHITYYNFKKIRKLLEKYFDVAGLEPTGGLFHKIFPSRVFSHKMIGLCIKRG
jgi:SAM-dependent methyltransferase